MGKMLKLSFSRAGNRILEILRGDNKMTQTKRDHSNSSRYIAYFCSIDFLHVLIN